MDTPDIRDPRVTHLRGHPPGPEDSPGVPSPAPLIALDSAQLEALTEQLVACAAEKIYQCQGQGGLTVSRAWIYQRPEQKRDMGEAAAPWYVGWIDPDKNKRGKSCGPGPDGKRNAAKLKRQIEAQLLTGTYGQRVNGTWAEFRAEYESKIVSARAASTQRVVRVVLDHFERLIAPGKMAGLKTAVIDHYRALRRREPGQQPGSVLNPGTLNKELRYLKAALGKARRWGYLADVPEFEMDRQIRRIKEWMPPDAFAAVYQACDQARRPLGQAYEPADWWRALLVTVYLTGWRIGAVLLLPRADVDLVSGTVLVRGANTKGKRDQLVPIHSAVSEHLRRLRGFTELMFPWPNDPRTLARDFQALQRAAGLTQVYGWHACKRAFCTLNAKRLEPTTLQFLAQHEAFETTRQYYIDPSSAAQEAIGKLYVPDVLRDAQ